MVEVACRRFLAVEAVAKTRPFHVGSVVVKVALVQVVPCGICSG
jgi:hypothetical protein